MAQDRFAYQVILALLDTEPDTVTKSARSIVACNSHCCYLLLVVEESLLLLIVDERTILAFDAEQLFEAIVLRPMLC